MSYTALVIPVEGPVYEIELNNGADSDLDKLQEAVGGHIEAVPTPEFVDREGRSTGYVNEEGKLIGLAANMRATDFFVPGVGLHFGDYISGTLVLCGFDLYTGEHAELPKSVVDRVRLIEREAS